MCVQVRVHVRVRVRERVCVHVHVHARVRVCVHVRVYKCRNAGLSGIDQFGTRLKKLTKPGIVWYRTKPRQSNIFLVRYQTEIIDAGMPMPALVPRCRCPAMFVSKNEITFMQ